MALATPGQLPNSLTVSREAGNRKLIDGPCNSPAGVDWTICLHGPCHWS